MKFSAVIPIAVIAVVASLSMVNATVVLNRPASQLSNGNPLRNYSEAELAEFAKAKAKEPLEAEVLYRYLFLIHANKYKHLENFEAFALNEVVTDLRNQLLRTVPVYVKEKKFLKKKLLLELTNILLIFVLLLLSFLKLLQTVNLK
jgi:hypothetical protein